MLWTIILWLLILALVACLALIFAPIQLRMKLAATPNISYRCDASVFFGLAPCITLADGPGGHAVASAKPGTGRARKSGIDKARLARAAPRMVADILRNIHLTSLKIDGEFGMADPSDTGQLAGLLLPAMYSRPGLCNSEIKLRPNFERACLEGEITAVFRLTLASFIPPVARSAWCVFGARS